MTLLASLLSNKYKVYVILYSGEAKANITNVQRLEEANIKVFKLSGSTYSKIKELKSIFIEYNIDCLFNYLTKPNFIGAIAGRMAGIARIYNGVRNIISSDDAFALLPPEVWGFTRYGKVIPSDQGLYSEEEMFLLLS